MRQIPIEVDSHLRLPDYFSEVHGDLTEQILDELTIENQQKIVAKRMRRWKWQKLPDDFLLARFDGDTLILPRGYALQLKLLLRENGIAVKWVDKRVFERGSKFRWQDDFNPRPHQSLAVKKMRLYQQGMYEAPTGSGKSLAGVKLIHDVHPKKSIILVDQQELLFQWINVCSRYLGAENVGQFGAGKTDDSKRITVATFQTIWSFIKRNKLPTDWFKRFSLTLVDECHHVPANSIQEIVSLFWSFLRLGESATPDRKNGKFEFALCVLGDVFHVTEQEELQHSGVLVKPKVKVVHTGFHFAYWPDHEWDAEDGCLKPRCKINKPHFHRNNYQNLRKYMIRDHARNHLVAHILIQEVNDGKHIHLISVDELQQLYALEEILRKRETHLPPLYVLTGESPKGERREIIRQLGKSEEAILLTTVAKEGVDIPTIDRIYMPAPISNPKKAQQIVGRGTRSSANKKETLIFDFVDEVSVLKKQFRKRRFQCYDKLGLEVIM